MKEKSIFCTALNYLGRLFFIFQSATVGTNVFVPILFYVDEAGMCHFVKFISRRDYNKMKKVFNKKKTSMEQEVNLQEQIELSTIIRKRALNRSKEALDRQKKAEQELKELTEQMVNIGIQSTLKIPEERRIWGETLKPRSWEETI